MRKPKKNLHKIPNHVRDRLPLLSGDKVIAACVRAISQSSIEKGEFGHLGIEIETGALRFTERLVPIAAIGKYSRWNVNGREVVRRDLPKVHKYFTLEVPNFGDWTKGMHYVDIPRDVYQREFIQPARKELSLALLRTESGDDPVHLFRVRVEDVLDRNAIDFSNKLLENLNLLQENVGTVNVFVADAAESEYLKTISVYWEILPPGQRNSTLARILSKLKRPSQEIKERLVERYNLLESLGPVAYISGSGGFQRYFGAQFREDLVVFENLELGNAIYVMFGNWEELSKMTRTELLAGRRSEFVRIVHRTGWEGRLRNVVLRRIRAAA